MKGVEIRVSSDSTQARRDLSNLEKSVRGIETTVNGVTKAFASMAAGLTLAIGGSTLTKSINSATDSMTNLENRIALITGRGKELTQQLNDLYNIADKTRMPIDAAAETFNRFGQALKGTGRTVEEINLAIESIGYAGAISGGSVDGLKAALMQLGQGLASGTLRGEELNSVLEQAPRITQAIADSIGVPVGSLKKLAEQGQLTSEVVFNALISQSEVLRGEFELVNQTSEQAMMGLGSSIKRVTAELSKEVGFTAGFTARINAITALINDNRERIVSSVGSVLNSLKDKFEGVVSVFAGFANIFMALVERAYSALPKLTLPMRTLKQEIIALGASGIFYMNALAKSINLDLSAAINNVLGTGITSSIRNLFNVSSIKEFGAALSEVGDSIRTYGKRWYNFGNQQEVFLRKLKVSFVETGVYLGILDQSLLRINYVSFERFTKAFAVLGEILGSFKQNVMASEVFVKIKSAIVVTLQYLKVFAEAFDNLFNNAISKSIASISRLGKEMTAAVRGKMTPAVALINKLLNEVEAKFFWVYDRVIGHSWWTDTMEGTYDLANSQLTKTKAVVSSFAREISDWYKYIFAVWSSNEDTQLKLDFTVGAIKLKGSEYLKASKELAGKLSASIGDSLVLGYNTVKDFSPALAGYLAVALTSAITAALSPSLFAATFAKLGPLFAISAFAGVANYLSKEILGSNALQLIGQGLGDAIGNAVNVIWGSLPDLTAMLLSAATSFGSAIQEQLSGTILGIPAMLLNVIPFGGGGLLTTLLYGGLTLAAFSSSFRNAVFGMIKPLLMDLGRAKGKGFLYNMFVGSDPKELQRDIQKQLELVRGPALMGLSKERRKAAQQDLKDDAKDMAERQARGNKRNAFMSIAKFGATITFVEAALGDLVGTGNALVLGMGMSFLEQMTFGPDGTKSVTETIDKVNDAVSTVRDVIVAGYTRARTVMGGILTTMQTQNLGVIAKIRLAWTAGMNGITTVFGGTLGKVIKFAGILGIASIAMAGFANASTDASGEMSTMGMVASGVLSVALMAAVANLDKLGSALKGIGKLVTGAFGAVGKAISGVFTGLAARITAIWASIGVAAGATFGTAFTTAAAAAIPVAITAAIVAAIVAAWDIFFNNASILKKIGNWIAFAFTRAGEYIGIGISSENLRKDIEKQLEEATSRFKKINLKVDISAELRNASLGSLNARDRGTLDRSVIRLNELSLEAMRDVAATGHVSATTQESIDAELKVQSDILRQIANPDASLTQSFDRLSEYLYNQRGFFSNIGDKFKLAGDQESVLSQVADNLLKIDVKALSADPTTSAAAISANLKRALDLQLIPEKDKGIIQDMMMLFDRISQTGVFTGQDADLIDQFTLALTTGDRSWYEVYDKFNDLFANTLSEADLKSLSASAEAERASVIVFRNMRTIEEALKSAGVTFSEDLATRLSGIEIGNLKTLADRVAEAKRRVELLTGQGAAPKDAKERGVREQAGKANGPEMIAAAQAEYEASKIALQSATEAASYISRAGDVFWNSTKELNTSLENLGVDVKFEFVNNEQQVTAIRNIVSKLAEYKVELNAINALSKLSADQEARRYELQGLIAAEQQRSGKLLGFMLERQELELRKINDVSGLVLDAFSDFSNTKFDPDKVLALNGSTLSKIAIAEANIRRLTLALQEMALAGVDAPLRAAVSKELSKARTELDGIIAGLESGVKATDYTGAGGGSSGFEKLMEKISTAGYDFNSDQVSRFSSTLLGRIKGPLKDIEDAQNRINKSAEGETAVRLKALDIIEKSKAKLFEIFAAGNVSQQNAAGQAMFGIDNLGLMNEKQIGIAKTIYDLNQRLLYTDNLTYDAKKRINQEILYQQELLESLTTTAESSAYAVRDSIKTSFSELLKGTKSAKDFLTSILDDISSKIIDTFVNGLVDSLWNNSPIQGFLEGLFGSVTQQGKGLGAKLGESISDSMTGSITTGVGGLFGEGGILSKMFGGIFGKGGFFSSIFGALGFGAQHAGGIVQRRISGGVINPAIGQAGKDSVPVMLTPGEYVLPSKQAADLFKKNGGSGSNQTVVNLNITGDISRQTKQEVMRMIPQIASGVNMTNKENGYR